MLEQGPTEKLIIEQCYKQRLPLPEKIANAPELFLGLELYFTAFLNLTSCRTQGYGTEGPIPFTQMQIYCEFEGINGDQREDLLDHMQHMDAAYLKHKAQKLKEQMGNGGS